MSERGLEVWVWGWGSRGWGSGVRGLGSSGGG